MLVGVNGWGLWFSNNYCMVNFLKNCNVAMVNIKLKHRRSIVSLILADTKKNGQCEQKIRALA